MRFNKTTLIGIFFFSLIILIPFLDFFYYNLSSINERTDLRVNFLTIQRLSIIYFIFLFFTSLIFLIYKKFSRSDFDLIIILSFIYWIFFQYNEIKELFDYKILNSLKKFDGFISLTIIMITIYLIIVIFKKKKNNFINFFFVIFFSINFLLSFYNFINIKNPSYVKSSGNIINENLNLNNEIKNNIYFIILDAMPPINLADKILNTDSKYFIKSIQNKKYNIVENSQSLYGNTFLSIGSTFNLKPLELIDYQLPSSLENLKYPNLTFPTVLRKNNVSNLEFNLSNLGYEIKWIGSHFANCYGFNRAYCLTEIETKNLIFNYETLSFLRKTPFKPIVSNLLKLLNIDIEENIIFKSNNGIEKLNNYLKNSGKPSKPTFLFTHHLVSHWPYLVNENCKFKKSEGRTNILGIKNAFLCNKKMILEFVNNIKRIDSDAIVIIQSDHNWELSYEDNLTYGDRRSILSLIKLNKFCKNENIPEDNINSMRLAIYCATHTKPIMLKLDGKY